MERLAAGVPQDTLLLDPANPAHTAVQKLLPGFRAIAADEVAARNILEASWLCVLDWRMFDGMPELRELLMRRRGRTVVIAGLSGEAVDVDGLVALRRFAGEVIAIRALANPEWVSRLVVPVTLVGIEGVVEALQMTVDSSPSDLGSVAAHLREAEAFVERGDVDGAALSAARVLAMAPERPEAVADVARLFVRMGRSQDAERLCKTFLLQRPDSPAVERALDLLIPVAS